MTEDKKKKEDPPPKMRGGIGVDGDGNVSSVDRVKGGQHVPLDDAKLERAVNTTEKLVRRMDALESRRKDDYGHPVKSNNRVQQTDYGQEADNKKSVDARRGQEDRRDADDYISVQKRHLKSLRKELEGDMASAKRSATQRRIREIEQELVKAGEKSFD